MFAKKEQLSLQRHNSLWCTDDASLRDRFAEACLRSTPQTGRVPNRTSLSEDYASVVFRLPWGPGRRPRRRPRWRGMKRLSIR